MSPETIFKLHLILGSRTSATGPKARLKATPESILMFR